MRNSLCVFLRFSLLPNTLYGEECRNTMCFLNRQKKSRRKHAHFLLLNKLIIDSIHQYDVFINVSFFIYKRAVILADFNPRIKHAIVQ